MSSITDEQEKIRTEIRNNIECVLGLGLFPVSDVEGLPMAVVSSFNTVILSSGNYFGWSNKKKYLLDKSKVLKKFNESFDFYNLSYTQLESTIPNKDTLEFLTPIIILNSAYPKDIVSRSAISIVYHHLALSYAGLAYQLLKPIIGNGAFLNTIQHHELLSKATCALLIAVEASFTGREQLFIANEDTREKIDRSEISFAVKNEVLLQVHSNAGKKSNKRYEKLYKFVEDTATARWTEEKSTGKKITLLTEMAESTLSAYKENFKEDPFAIHVSINTIKKRLRPIARKTAPEASARGRPKSA